ncbi:MAG TPA: ABC transporter permease [Rugosimonospora sp.]|nr:ABC transporter permease [Rugosimonospora sp.]
MYKFARDTWLVFARQMGLLLRNPVWVFVGIMQPLFFLLLFGPLLKGIPGMGGTNAYKIFIPGLLIQLAIFGTLFVGFPLVAELRMGIIERMRVTPVSRFALLLGRAGSSTAMLLFQGLLLVVLALPFGLRVQVGPLLLTLALLALIGVLCSSLSYGVALWLKSEDALAPLLNMVSMPVLLLAGILLPMTYGPGWLRGLAGYNPFKWAVDAARALFAGHPGNGAVWKALVIVGALAVVGVSWAARSFAKAVR